MKKFNFLIISLSALKCHYLFIVLWILTSCQPNDNTTSDALKPIVKDLTKIELTVPAQDSVWQKIYNDSLVSIPVYNPQGEKLTYETLKKGVVNIIIDVYEDNNKTVKAYVKRSMTSEELKKNNAFSEEENRKELAKIVGLNKNAAPLFSVKNINGETLDLAQMKGKVIVMNFWFIACKACVQEMPELNRMVADYKDKNVVFIGLTFDKQEKTVAFLKKTQFDYNIVADAKNIFTQYGISPCPVNLIIDTSGKITYSALGYDAENDKIIRSAIEKVLN